MIFLDDILGVVVRYLIHGEVVVEFQFHFCYGDQISLSDFDCLE